MFGDSATSSLGAGRSTGAKCRKPRLTPSRDYDEQRLGILYSLLKSEYIYARYRARRRPRDSDLSAPRFHWQSRFPSNSLPLIVLYLPLLPHS